MNTRYIFITLLVVIAIGVLFRYATIHAPEEVIESFSEEELLIETEDIGDTPIGSGSTIDLRRSGLTAVPGYIFQEKDTEVLLLSGNSLTGSLPAEVRHLQKLKILDLSSNNFTGVPAEVGQLQELEVLNLSGNPITGLPLEIGNLQNLKTLDVRGTQYSEYDLNILRESLPTSVQILVK